MERGKKGFTLMEMLIVVAIIGILVAIAVPVFSHTMEKTKATACAANRRTAKGMIAQAVMFNDDAAKRLEENKVYEWSVVNQVLTSAGYSLKENLCPSGGILTLNKKNGAYIVVCDVHGEGDAEGMKDAMDILKKASGGTDYDFVRSYIAAAGGVDKLPKADSAEILKMMDGTAGDFGKTENDKKLVWVGMQVKFKEEGEVKGTAHEILVVTTKSKAIGNNNNPALHGYMFYYNGKYYQTTKVTDKGNYDFASFYSGSNWTIDKSFDDCLKDGGWKEIIKP